MSYKINPFTGKPDISGTGGGGGSSFTWNSETGTSVTAASNCGYMCSNSALTSVALPSASSFGDEIIIVALGSGGVVITQGAGQSIRFGSLTTTVGPTGSVASTAQGDVIRITCSSSNTSWVVISSIGNLTVT